MKMAPYREYMTAEILMGPNSVRILAELLDKHPLTLVAEDVVLDLGCGKGLTSYAIARETGARVYANDLWIPAEENAHRFNKWGVSEQVTPICEDANVMSFSGPRFQTLISVDAYHYFGTARGFFVEKILPLMKDGAEALIAIPGMQDAYAGRSEALLTDWLGNEAYMFRSPEEWRVIIGCHERIASVETWELTCFDEAWADWFATGHEFAAGDKRFFETLIRPYTCFVGIHVKLT